MSEQSDPRQKVALWRAEAGYSQVDLAKKLLISPSLLSLLESGKKYIGHASAVKLEELSGGKVLALDVMSPEQRDRVERLELGKGSAAE